MVTVLRFVKIADLGKTIYGMFYKNEKYTIKSACKIGLPDDEHMISKHVEDT